MNQILLFEKSKPPEPRRPARGRTTTEDRRGRPCSFCNQDVSVAAAMKPLFVPLATRWYEKFESGEKDTEYRQFGPRWNFKTCIVGRSAILSKG